MKKALIIAIVIFFPSIASAYNLLQPETHGIRVSLASLLLAEEQSAQPPAGQPAPNITQEQKSPDLKPVEKPKTLKPKSYWIPLILDSVPITIASVWSYYCSTKKDSPRDCFKEFLIISYFTLPPWSLISDAYVSSSKTKVVSSFLAKILAIGIFHLTDYVVNTVDAVVCGTCEFGCSPCPPEGRPVPYKYFIAMVSVMQVAEAIYHINKVYENNVEIIPYATLDRAGLACQYNF